MTAPLLTRQRKCRDPINGTRKRDTHTPPRRHAPPPPPPEPARRGKSLWAEEALSKQRNAAWNPGDWGGEEGGGGAAEAACFPSSQPRGTPPTPSPGCGAGEEGGGCGSRLFSISLLQTKAEKSTSSAAPLVCSTLYPERVSASAQSRLPSLPKCPKTRRALGTCPAAVRRASRAGRSRPALVRLSPAGGDAGSTASLPGPRSRPGRAPARGGRHTRVVDLANTPFLCQVCLQIPQSWRLPEKSEHSFRSSGILRSIPSYPQICSLERWSSHARILMEESKEGREGGRNGGKKRKEDTSVNRSRKPEKLTTHTDSS
ncbi:uncharacterized protein [Ovis canadensis]|uniref:uncharacterized protein n=1 Tax=Ovis canadensis TaxID=37174 RepID=UPI0037526CE8